MSNKEISLNIKTIISHDMTWKEAINIFNLQDSNLQQIYLRYIIAEYGIKTANKLLCEYK